MRGELLNEKSKKSIGINEVRISWKRREEKKTWERENRQNNWKSEKNLGEREKRGRQKIIIGINWNK